VCGPMSSRWLGPSGAEGVARLPAAMLRRAPRFGDETVHLPASDVVPRRGPVVRGSLVQVGTVVERRHGPARMGIGQADGGYAVPHWDPVGSRVGPEVAVEGPVLLHDYHDMPDLVNVWVDRRRWRGRPGKNRGPTRWPGRRFASLAASQRQGSDNDRCHARSRRRHKTATSTLVESHGDTLGACTPPIGKILPMNRPGFG